MNKKLLYPALTSLAIQFLTIILFVTNLSFFSGVSLLIIAFYVYAIPYTIIWFIHSFKQYDKKHKILHSLCVLATLPLLFIAVFILIELFPVQYEPEDIDIDQIHVYDAAGNEIPTDSILQKVVKDSVRISRMQIDEK